MRGLVGVCIAAAFSALGCGESFSSGDTPDGAGGAGGAGGSAGSGARALVLNEVDYQNPTVDNMEFVEIFNPGDISISLDSISLVLVNGAAGELGEYGRFDLSGPLGPRQYMVVCNALVLVAPGARSVVFVPVDQIQNEGSAPDAIALLDRSSGQLIDALSYGGEVRDAPIDGAGSFDFVEGNPTPVTDTGAGSMIRVPNGNDTNNAEADWQISPTPSPGADN
jgi:vibriolysin